MASTIVALHQPQDGHLGEVAHEMIDRWLKEGEASASPRILGYREDWSWQAICGSHRIAAAVALGIPVTLEAVDPDAPLTEDAIIEAAGELLADLPIGLTPREIVAERERLGSGVTYRAEVSRG